jgi:hypothetical protein
MQTGDPQGCLEAYRRALAEAKRAGEQETEVAVAQLTATQLEIVGDRDEADRARLEVLRRCEEINAAPRRMYTAFAETVFSELHAGRPRLALAFAESQARLARQDKNPLFLAEGESHRAIALVEIGRHQEAAAAAAAGRAEAQRITSPAFHDRILADLEFTTGRIEQLEGHADRAVAAFSAAIQIWQNPPKSSRGEAALAAGQRAAAERDFTSGVTEVETLRERNEPTLRISYFERFGVVPSSLERFERERKVMDVEIIFSGLASFLNIRHPDPKLTEPSVILVRTNDDGKHDAVAQDHHGMPGMEHSAGGSSAAPPPPLPGSGTPPAPDPDDHNHIPFLSFNTEEVKVDNATGFIPVPDAISHMYMPLDGVELVIQNDPPAGKLRVHQSYDNVADKDKYWPASRGKFNHDFVPRCGEKPKKEAVSAYVRFGSGELAAGKMALAAWVFFDAGKVTHSGVFAEEVIYRDFPHTGHDVVIMMADLVTGRPIHTVRFSPLSPYQEKLTLAIGNHVASDLNKVVRREQANVFKIATAGSHFAFLNAIAAMPAPGPLPKPVAVPQPPSTFTAGGPQGGPCGPVGGGGGTGGGTGG